MFGADSNTGKMNYKKIMKNKKKKCHVSSVKCPKATDPSPANSPLCTKGWFVKTLKPKSTFFRTIGDNCSLLDGHYWALWALLGSFLT